MVSGGREPPTPLRSTEHVTAHAPYETHALITAAAAAQVSWMTDVARATGGRVWREGTVLCVHHPLPRDELHLLFPARLEPDELERVLDWCATSGVGTVGCWSSGIGQDEHVRAVLEADGFEEGWQPHWMAATLPLRDVEADVRVESATEVPEY